MRVVCRPIALRLGDVVETIGQLFDRWILVPLGEPIAVGDTVRLCYSATPIRER